MRENNIKALKSSVWYIAANFLTGASAFLTTPIFTRLLTQEQFGIYNNFTSWQSILAIVLTINVQASLITARYDYEDDLYRYIFSVLGLSSASVLVVAVIFNLARDWSENFFSLRIFYLNWMLAHILFLKVLEVFQTEQRYFFKYKAQVALSVSSTVASLCLSVILVLTMRDRLTGRVIGSVLPGIIIGACLLIYYLRKGRGIRFSYWKYALRICLPYIPHLLSMTVLSSTDRIMITRMCGPTDAALYSLAYNCGSMITVLLNAVNTAFSPWLADRLHDDDSQSVRRFSKYYISAFVCVSLAVAMLAPEALYVLGGERYLSAIYVMPPVTMGCICQFLYTMMVNVEQIKGKTVGMAFASTAAALTNYVLNLIFIPRYGYIAAAYTTLVGYLLLLVLHMWMVYRMGMSGVYSYRFIVIALLAVFAAMAAINASYSSPFLRYAGTIAYALIMATVLWSKRGRIASVLRARKQK